ncbi:MAG: DUF3566 domain-containing protein [Actinomycetota bacterium]
MASTEHGREGRPAIEPSREADARRAGGRGRERLPSADAMPPPKPPRGASAPGGVRERTFEVLDQPLPSERTRQGGARETQESARTPRSRAGTVEAPARSPEERPKTAAERRRRTRVRPARGAVRRVKRTLKRVDLWSVLKMSLFYYTIFLVLWLVVVAVLFSFIEATGLFESIEEVGRGIEIEELANFEISLGTVLRWAAYIGGVMVILASLVNVVLAFLYNLGSDIVGGIEVTFVERDE